MQQLKIGGLNYHLSNQSISYIFLQFLTENTEFTVVGVIGPPGVGKSTIMNELYGFDGSSPGLILFLHLIYIYSSSRH